jgi:hypothetical protein
MQFDVVVTNPPFQDSENRGRTRHKLWIDFTREVFDKYLVDGGTLAQVSPSSFRSPSNRVLDIFRRYQVSCINYDTGQYFPEVASSFSDYVITKSRGQAGPTLVRGAGGETHELTIDEGLFYLPNVDGPAALSVHRKVIFDWRDKLQVERDYVTCHNILLKRSDTLSKEPTDRHIHPVLHTNRQTWWSSVKQSFADDLKVMWSRSGYTTPFFDPGKLGCTDMAYFVRVRDHSEGEALAHNLNLTLLRYVYKTARWSGFGNERVFDSLPNLPRDAALTDNELFDRFGLTTEEVDHVRSVVGKGR